MTVKEGVEQEIEAIFETYGNTLRPHELDLGQARHFFTELFEIFGERYPDSMIIDLFMNIDRNKDGFISKQELKEIIFSGVPFFVEAALQKDSSNK